MVIRRRGAPSGPFIAIVGRSSVYFSDVTNVLFIAQPVACHVVVSLQRISFRSVLVAAVLLSVTFAGCFDQKEEKGKDGPLGLFQRGEDPVRVDDLEQYYRVRPPSECQGCIPLDQGRSLPAPPTPRAQTLEVPFPAGDDQLLMNGRFDMDPADVRPIVPVDREGRYEVVLHVMDGDADAARFVVVPYDHNVWEAPIDDVHVNEATWNISLSSRTVRDAEVLGHTRVQGALTQSLREVEIHYTPDLETLFWLGTHLWGRELSEGDRFATHWALPGLFDERVDLRYEVKRVLHEGVSYHAPGKGHWGHPSLRLVDAWVRVHATDATGTSARWDLYLDGDSPYPVHVSSVHHDGVSATAHLPFPLVEHHAQLRQRGDLPLPWGSALRVDRLGPAPEGFVLGDRDAPEALDRLPRYPLGTALADLGLFHGYRAFADQNPQRVLIEARYDTRLMHSPSVWEHEWQLTFTNRQGISYLFHVARLSTEFGLMPASHAQERTLVEQSEVARFLTVEQSSTFRIGSGRATLDALEDQGIGEVDALSYRLEQRGAGLGARLDVARMLLGPSLIEDGDLPLGFVEEDLGAGRLVSVGRLVE